MRTRIKYKMADNNKNAINTYIIAKSQNVPQKNRDKMIIFAVKKAYSNIISQRKSYLSTLFIKNP